MIGLSPIKAFAALRVPRHTGWALADESTPEPLLPSVVVKAPNGRHEFRRFGEGDVQLFAERFATTVQIAEAAKMPRRKLVAQLREARVRPAITRSDFGIDIYAKSELPGLLAA